MPKVGVSEFINEYKAAVAVQEILMADANIGSPTVITEPQPNATAFVVSVTTLVTAGTPVQLGSLAVPDGRALVVASALENDPKKKLYVATSSANALLPANRVSLSTGGSVRLFVSNADLVWIDGDLSGLKAVALVEQ